MKLMRLALTLSGIISSACAGGGSDPTALGCNPSNTTAAPSDGIISAFSVPGSGVNAEVGRGPASAAPIFTVNGTLRIIVNTPVLSTSQLLLVDLPFPKCVDATAFTGVAFSISGSLSGCGFAQATQDSAHQHPNGSSSGPGSYGTGPADAHPNSTVLTADQISSVAQTVRAPFAAQTGGVPATPTDASKLTWLDWVFAIEPLAPGEPTACQADLTISDVRFY